LTCGILLERLQCAITTSHVQLPTNQSSLSCNNLRHVVHTSVCPEGQWCSAWGPAVGAQLDTVQYRSVALLLMYGEFCAVLILILCCCCWYRTHAEKAIDIITSILPDDHLLLASSKRVKGLSRACATVKQISKCFKIW